MMPPETLLCDVPEIDDVVVGHLAAVGIYTVGQLFKEARVSPGDQPPLVAASIGDVVWAASDYRLTWRECVCVFNTLRIARKPAPAKGGAA